MEQDIEKIFYFLKILKIVLNEVLFQKKETEDDLLFLKFYWINAKHLV